MKIRKQFLFALTCLVFCCSLHAKDYYVDASYTGSSDGSKDYPWKSLADVNGNMSSFGPGDIIHFQKGQVFTGWLNLYRSGTSSAPLTFTTYGDASEPPTFQYTLPNGSQPINEKIIAISNAQYVVIDGIKLLDHTMSETNHSELAKVGYGVYIYQSHNITLKNLNISRVGIGIMVEGNNNLITNNEIHNLREIVNTASPTYDDFGAIGVNIKAPYTSPPDYSQGSYNKVYNNYIHDCWAPSSDYTFDGGAVEFSGPVQGNEVLYNKAVNNEGWMQVNAGSGGLSDNNLIAYNLLINNGRIFWFNLKGWYGSTAVTLQVQNLKFYNNNVIETVMHYSRYPYLIGVDAANAPNNLLDLRNNIFFLNTAATLTYSVGKPFSSGQTHKNNIYYLPDYYNDNLCENEIGYPLDGSEAWLKSSVGIFTDISNTNPESWDYTLTSESPALNFGQSVGLTRDFAGNPVPSGTAPDAGILELQPSIALPLEFTNFYGISEGKIDLFWTCADEWETNSFEVQRSLDGRIFQTIGRVKRALTPSAQAYHFSDASLLSKTVYYRIKATTENGAVYSKVIFFNAGKPRAITRVYPNPVSSKLNIESSSSLQNAQVLVVNSSGQSVKEFTISGNVHKYELYFGDQVPGIYFVKVVQDGNLVYQATVVK